MLKLKRIYLEKYTTGRLDLYNDNDKIILSLYTLESPFKNNKKNISCIPDGDYVIKKHYSPIFKECIKVYDIDGISEVKDRSDIFIHAGNCFNDTKGSILVGNFKMKDLLVLNSQESLKQLLKNIKEEDILSIN